MRRKTMPDFTLTAALLPAAVAGGLIAGLGSHPAAAVEAIVPPGIYAKIKAKSLDDPLAPMQAIMGCTSDPTIFHPDGMMIVKTLDAAGTDASEPYRHVGHGMCSLDGAALSCRYGTGAPGNPTLYGALDQTLDILDGGHLAVLRPAGDVESIFARCDPDTLRGAAPDGTVLDAILMRADTGPVFDPAADGPPLRTAENSPNQASASTAPMPGDSLPPGVYIQSSIAPDSPDAPRDYATKCSSQPIVAYPDGRFIGKSLDSYAASAGGAPYRVELDAQCAIEDAGLACEGHIHSRYGEPPQPMRQVLALTALAGGNFAVRGNGMTGYLARCNVDDLNQSVDDGRNVLAEILRRGDDGPIPRFEGIDIAVSTLPSASTGAEAFGKGDWHGSVKVVIAGADIEIGLDINQPAGTDYASAAVYAMPPTKDLPCDSLDPALCAEFRWLGADGSFETVGTIVLDESLLVALELNGFDDTGSALRLIEIRRRGDEAEFIYYHPGLGAGFSALSSFDPHWCEAPETIGEDFCRDATEQMAELVNSVDGVAFIGVFGRDNPDILTLLEQAPQLAARLGLAEPVETGAPASNAGWGGLATGIHANLLGVNPDDRDWLQERCQSSPTISYADGTIVSKAMFGARYGIETVFTCNAADDAFRCDVTDGVAPIASDLPVRFERDGGRTNLCYTLAGETLCETFHACSVDLVDPGRLDDLIARADGGVPLAITRGPGP